MNSCISYFLAFHKFLISSTVTRHNIILIACPSTITQFHIYITTDIKDTVCGLTVLEDEQI